MTSSSTPSSPAGSGEPSTSKLYWSIVSILIFCSVGAIAGRIMECESTRNGERVPFFSANDRSRWCTVRALVDHGTFAIDEVIELEGGENWDTIDKVYHVGPDGEYRYYSSKPTLLPTLVAGKYWLLKTLTGKSISEHPFFVIRWLLFLTNGVGLAIGLFALARIARLMTDQLGPALFVVACGCFGTYWTSFAITFSNHVPAAVCVAVSLALLIPIWQQKNRTKLAFSSFVLLGLISSLVAAFELPGLSFVAAVLVLCAIKSFSRTLLGFVPASLMVAAAFFGTNHWAHGTWVPAYAHRSDGPVLETVDGDFAEALDRGELPSELKEKISGELSLLPTVTRGFWPGHEENRWIVDFGKESQLVIAQVKAIEDGSNLRKFEIREWNNWYEYPTSYWLTSNLNKADVDRGEPDSFKYLTHVTVGHHGVFSLTPIWVLAGFGIICLCFSGRHKLRLPALAILSITLVVFAFYVFKVPAHDRNYGGWTCCFRWAIWMYPLWLACMVPVAEILWKNRLSRWLLWLLLLLSAISANSASSNPWTHPWLQNWFF